MSEFDFFLEEFRILSRRWSWMAGLERRGLEGRFGLERKELSGEGDFLDFVGFWWG